VVSACVAAQGAALTSDHTPLCGFDHSSFPQILIVHTIACGARASNPPGVESLVQPCKYWLVVFSRAVYQVLGCSIVQPKTTSGDSVPNQLHRIHNT
jgi:hypothetical protein